MFSIYECIIDASSKKRETFSPEELEKIAVALGGVYEFGFTFSDGAKIIGINTYTNQ